jgi:hypothetical protein
MKKITNVFCMLDKLSQRQLDNLKVLMGDGIYQITGDEDCIGLTENGRSGCWWSHIGNKEILTYAEMVSLLSPPIKLSEKAMAAARLLCAKSQAEDIHQLIIDNQAEQEHLQAIIDKPNAKTGRVLFVDDIKVGDRYYVCDGVRVSSNMFNSDEFDTAIISLGEAFHDSGSCEQYRRELITAQSLRRQAAKANP